MTTWPLSTELVPNYDGGLMRAKWLKGGLRTVKTKALRNSLPYLYRYMSGEETTLCFVEAENQFYKLINNPTGVTIDADWELVNLGGITSSLLPIGTWDIGNTSPVLTDTGAAGKNGQFYFVTGAPTPQTITVPNLFEGLPVTLVDGNLIVSVGTRWIVVANSTAWNSIDKPQVITDYVDGVVIAHSHLASDITDLATYLNDYLKRSDIADNSVPFDSVPGTDLADVDFLRTWYYTKTEVQDLINDLEDGGVTTFLGLTDTPNTYIGQGLSFPRVNAAENGLEFIALSNVYWSLSGTSTLSADAIINIDGKNLNFRNGATQLLQVTSTAVTSFADFVAAKTIVQNPIISSGASNYVATTLSPTYNPSSGTSTFTTFQVSPTYNFTGSYVGRAVGIYYNPTITSATGLTHLAANLVSGAVLIGDTNVTAGTNLDVVAQSTLTTNIVRFANTSNNSVFRINNGTGVIQLGFHATFVNPTIGTSSGGPTEDNGGLSLLFRTGFNNNNQNHRHFRFIAAGSSPSSSNGGAMVLTNTFALSTGTTSYTHLELIPTYNTTSTYSGTAIGLDYNPTLTSVTGLTHIAARFNSGRVQINSGWLLVTSNDNGEGVNVGSTSLSGSVKLYVSGGNEGTLFFNQNGFIRYQQTSSSTTSGAIRVENFQSFTVTTGTAAEFGVGSTFAPSSGSATYKSLIINPTYNTTGTYVGTAIGIDYSPTLTATIGLTHIAFRNTTGQIIFGASSPASDTQVTIDRSNPVLYNNLIRLQSSGTQLWNFNASGIASHTASTAITTGTFAVYTIGGTFNPSSGTAEYNAMVVSPTFNTTATYVGTSIGYKYSATRTTVVGLTELAISTIGGQILFATSSGATVTANTRLDVRGISGGNIMCGFNSSGTQRYKFTDAGALIIGTDSDGTTITTGTRTVVFAGVSNYGATSQFTFSAGANNATSGTAVVLDYAGNTINPSSGNASFIFARITGNFEPTGTTSNGFYTILRLSPIYNFTVGTNTVYGIDYDPTPTSLTGATVYGLLIRPTYSLNGFGLTSPTALLDVGASSASRSGFRLRPGPAPTSPNDGDIWIDSTAHTMHVRINGVTKTFTLT